MKELQEKIEKFNEERDWDQFHSPVNLAKSICIEAGELLECFQWNDNYDLEVNGLPVELYIEDLNSTNGTFINEEPLAYKEQRKLDLNDIVQFADIRYRFC